MRINHYVINLDRSQDRLAAIMADAGAAGIDIVRVPAVDGRATPEAERAKLLDVPGFLRDHGKRPQPGEYGCYASHLRAFEAFLTSDAEIAVIFEDDAAPDATFRPLVDEIASVDDWDLVKLVNYRMPRLKVDRVLSGGIRMGRAMFGPTGGSAAYMLNRKAASAMLESLRPMTLPYDVALERGWAHGIRVRHVEPNAVGLNPLTNEGTTMEGKSYSAFRLKPWQRLPTLRFRARDFVARIAAAFGDGSMSRQRFFFLRRRTDTLLLTAAMALIGVLVSLGKGLFALVALIGVVHAIIRPASWRLAPPAFSIVLAAYVVWSIGLSLGRGEGFDGNRLLSYAAIEAACVFLPLGLFFVRRPLDAMILGARLGVVALLIATPLEFWITGMRVGLGRNEAILGFIAAAFGLIARLPMERPPRILPNGRWWLYLSFVPALLSQTRATWGIYPIFGVIDLIHVWRRVVGIRDRRSLAALALGACVAAAALLPMSDIIVERANQAVAEVERYEETGVALGSVDVRMAMWSSAYAIWRENPLTGIGHVDKMETVAERSGVNAAQVGQYTHLHNLVVDEALNSGLIGTVLLVGVFVVFLWTVFMRSSSTMLRETSVVFVFLVFSYGSFHGVLLNEWMVTVIFGYMSVTLSDLRRKQLRAAWGRA